MRMTAAASLSFWARQHRVQARLLIAFATTAIMLIGAALGNLWIDEGLRMGPAVLATIFAIYLAVFPLYPVIRRRASWLRRKAFDAVLIGCTALLGIWLGVQHEAPRSLTELQTASAAVSQTGDASPTASNKLRHRFEQKLKRGMSLLELVFRRPVRFGDPVLFDTVAKIALTALALVLMLALMYAVFAISCSLSCSGNAVGGTLVLTLGGLGVLALFVLAIIRIYRGQRWIDRRGSRG